MAVMFHNEPTHIFTLDEFAERAKDLNPKRNTLHIYCKRFRTKGICDKIKLPNGIIGYRCASVHKALAYIEGRFEEYDDKLTPKAQPAIESTDIVHRNGYRLRLPRGAFERLKAIGEYHKHGKSPSHYLFENDTFSIESYPPKGNSVIFLKGDWKPDVVEIFGEDAALAVKHSIDNGGMIGIAKDIPWKEIYAKPIQLLTEKGVALYRVARSQKKEGEIDIHRFTNDEEAKVFEEWWDDKRFKADMLKAALKTETFQNRTFDVFNLITKRLETLEQNQLKMAELLNQSLNGKKPDSKPPLPPKEPDKWDGNYR